MRRRLKRLFLSALILAGGCFNRAADHCPGCTIVTRRALSPPPLPAGTRARVILVGGGFGFGDEWRPVIAALRASRVDFYVFSWPGPFQDPPREARALTALLQADLARVERLVVLAHSAGGMLSNFVARQLRVPPGHQLFLASIAGGRDMNFAPYVPDEKVNTPMGMAMGGGRRPIPPVPPGVVIIHYQTEDPPTQPAPDNVYLGARVGHDESVERSAIPLVQALSRPGDLWYR